MPASINNRADPDRYASQTASPANAEPAADELDDSIATDAGAAEPGEPAVAAEPYTYGLASGQLHTYVSDSDLLAWFANKSKELNGNIRDQLELSDQRGKMMKDISHLQTMAESHAAPAEMQQEMLELRAAYAGTPLEKELNATLVKFDGAVAMGVVMDISGAAWELGPFHFQEDSFAKELKAFADKVSHDDQAAILRIQDLTSDLRQISQMVSSLMSSSDQTTKSILSNWT